MLESDAQSVISYLCVWLPKLTSTKEGTIIPMGGRGGCTRRCFDFKRLIIHINYSLILAYHLITKTCLCSTNSPTNMMPILMSFICDMTLPFLFLNTKNLITIYCTNFLSVPSSFLGKIYTHQRREHIPGVRFCKYLLANLLTDQYVFWGDIAFIFSPLPIWITWSNLLSWTMCLLGLSDQNLKKTDPKEYPVKKLKLH